MREIFYDCGFTPFMILGLISFVYFGFFADKIHKVHYENKHEEFYQIFFNGLGAFIGWIAVYYLWSQDLFTIEFWEVKHFIALYVAYVGVTGNLPYVVKFFKS